MPPKTSDSQTWGDTRPATLFTPVEGWRIRAFAVAVALAAWSLLIAFVLLVFAPLRPIALGGLVLCVVCLAASFALGWTLYCPWCCKRMFFVSSMANSPGLGQILRMILPRQIVVSGRVMCPHCRSRFALSRS